VTACKGREGIVCSQERANQSSEPFGVTQKAVAAARGGISGIRDDLKFSAPAGSVARNVCIMAEDLAPVTTMRS
jgi:hypothetical protein